MVARMYIWPRYALEVDGKRIVFPEKPGAALARLFRHPGALVSMDELIEAVYFDDPDGGPVLANNCIRVFVHRMRKLLNKVGIDVLGYRGTGGFRLVLPGHKIPSKYVEPLTGHHGSYRYVGRDPSAHAYDVRSLTAPTTLGQLWIASKDGVIRKGKKSSTSGPT